MLKSLLGIKTPNEKLYEAIKAGKINDVNAALAEKADPNDERNFGTEQKPLIVTPLSYAAAYGSLEIIKILIKADAAPQALENQAVLLAAEYGHVELVEFLRKELNNKNLPDPIEHNADMLLFITWRSPRCIHVLEYLLKNENIKLLINSKNKKNQTPLSSLWKIEDARLSSLDKAKMTLLLLSNGATPQIDNPANSNILMQLINDVLHERATLQDISLLLNSPKVHDLLNRKATCIDAWEKQEPPVHERTPLEHAIIQGNVCLVSLLLSAGATYEPGLPLQWATGVKYPRIEMIHYLRTTGHDFSSEQVRNRALSKLCMDEDDLDEINNNYFVPTDNQKEVFESRPFQPDYKKANDSLIRELQKPTPNENTIENALLSRYQSDRADPNCDYLKPKTPLILAVEHGNIKVVKMLLVAGAYVNAQYNGLSAYDIAKIAGKSDIAKLLEDAGAEKNTPASQQEKDLYESHLDIFSFLDKMKFPQEKMLLLNRALNPNTALGKYFSNDKKSLALLLNKSEKISLELKEAQKGIFGGLTPFSTGAPYRITGGQTEDKDKDKNQNRNNKNNLDNTRR